MRLDLKEIERTYGNTTILFNVSAQVTDKEIIGLVGRNGAGKSTLCNVIAGYDKEFDGTRYVYPQTHIAYFKQLDPSFSENDVTVFDYILSTQKEILAIEKEYHELLALLATDTSEKTMERFGEAQDNYFNLGAYNLLERIGDTLTGLGVNEDGTGERNVSWTSKMGTLSGGERKIVELATILLDKKANLLILDEPTNHLDIRGREWLEGFIRGFEGSVILVSHDRHLLDKVCGRVWDINKGTLYAYEGNYTQFKKQKEDNYDALLHQYETQQKEYKRLQEIYNELKRKVLIGGGPAIVGQYNAMRSRVEKFEKTLIENPKERKAAFHFTLQKPPGFGYNAIRVQDLNFTYADGRVIFDHASADILNGERIALLGDNGSGKSTLMKLILTQYCKERRLYPKEYGIDAFFEKNKDNLGDSISIGPSVSITYYSQNHAQLDGSLSIREFLQTRGIRDEGTFQGLIRRFQFDKDTVDSKLIGDLSGGEKSKLQFLLVMLSQANVLLLDEPINHLDISSMEVIESLLMEFKGTIIVISHDQYFLDKVITKVLKVTDNKINEYVGTYSEFLEKESRKEKSK